MKTLIFIFLTYFPFIQIFAQNYEWASSFGSNVNDSGNSITVDNSGNVYITGYFEGTVDFDPGPGVLNLISQGSQDIFIQKLDPSGNLIWAHSFGSLESDNGKSVTVDGQGNVLITGNFRATVDFDPGVGTASLSSSGYSDAFILKLNSSGDYVWAVKFGSNSGNSDFGEDIEVDALGNVYCAGSFSGSVDFDPGIGTLTLVSQGHRDAFILKLDSNGNLIWVQKVGSTTIDEAFGLDLDADGNVLVVGAFTGNVDFDPGAATFFMNSSGSNDVFVLKLNAAGNFVWAKRFGAFSTDIAHDVVVDDFGNVYSTGYFNSTVDFDPGNSVSNLSSAGDNDVFIHKLDSEGDFVWARKLGSNAFDVGNAIALDNTGNIYITGYFFGTVDFDHGPAVYNLASAGMVDVFIQKLDPAGNLVWAEKLGSTSFDYGNSIAIDNAANIYLTGNFSGTVDFDLGAGIHNLTADLSDIFVTKMNQSLPCTTTYGNDEVSACGAYTWIDGNTYTQNNNSAQFTLTNAAGCDSVVTLDLTIWDCTNLNSTFCGATDVAMNQLVNAETRPGALQYRFRITGTNSQSWASDQFIYTSTSKNFRFQFIPGSMWGETYGVEVAYSTVPGVFGPYGPSCSVTLQSLATLPLSSVNAAVCDATVEMNASISTPWVPGALGYRYQIVGNNSAMWPSNTVVVERPVSPRQFRFIDVAGSMFGETYAVSVAFQDGSGNWSAYGAPCNITIVSGITQLDLASCGATNVLLGDFLLADNVIGAAGYRFRITGANSAGWPMDQIEVDRNNRVFWMNLADGWLPGETYLIEVAVQDAAGNYGAYGSACSITMFGTPSLAIVNVDAAAQTKATNEGAFGATASHNPFTRDFALNLVNANDTDSINVAIYDMSGKLIEASSVNPMDIESARFGANLATGMYMIQVTQGANKAVIRQVKQ